MDSFLLFILTFFLIVNRYWIRSFIEGFTSGRANSKDIKDEKTLKLIKDKTGLKLSKIKLLDTNKTWAMMVGLPTMPYMVISKDAYENFTKDELEWVLLHEAGHYVFWHNVKMIFLHLVFIIAGFLILMELNTYFNPLILALPLGVLSAVIYTQIARRFEYEANDFALSKMDNPTGVENMYEKAKNRWRKKGIEEDGLFQRLFNVWILDIYRDLIIRSKTAKIRIN